MLSKTSFKLKNPSELQCKAKTKADEWLYKLNRLHCYDPFDLTMIYHALSHARTLMNTSSFCLNTSRQMSCHSRTHREKREQHRGQSSKRWMQWNGSATTKLEKANVLLLLHAHLCSTAGWAELRRSSPEGLTLAGGTAHTPVWHTLASCSHRAHMRCSRWGIHLLGSWGFEQPDKPAKLQ